MEDLSIRPATPQDAEAAAELLLELPGGLVELVGGDREASRRAAAAAFVANGSVFGWSSSWVAEWQGVAKGLMATVRGADWEGQRRPTGTAILRAVGARHWWKIVRRGRLQERLVPPIAKDVLHVLALVVAADARSRGLGSALLGQAMRLATNDGLNRLTLDVGADNERAITLYERRGFVAVSENHRPARAGLPAVTSLRMELVI